MNGHFSPEAPCLAFLSQPFSYVDICRDGCYTRGLGSLTGSLLVM